MGPPPTLSVAGLTMPGMAGGGGGKPTGGGGGGKPTGGGGEPTGGGGPVTVMHVMDILAGLERTVERRESIRKMLPPTKALWTSETMMT